MTRLYVDRRPHSWAGDVIGILTLETAIPYVPGNVSNATTFAFPVRYKTIAGASIDRLLNQSDSTLLDSVIAAARELEAEGVRAVTGACGFMALFQREVASVLRVPVFLSSLLQVPMIHAITRRPIGIITANEHCLKKEHLAACGIRADMPLIISGMQDQTEFRAAILEECGSLDSTRIEAEAVSVARNLIADHPEVGAVLLECSDLPRYSRAIQRAVNRPVFDYISMINWMGNGVRQRAYDDPL